MIRTLSLRLNLLVRRHHEAIGQRIEICHSCVIITFQNGGAEVYSNRY